MPSLCIPSSRSWNSDGGSACASAGLWSQSMASRSSAVPAAPPESDEPSESPSSELPLPHRPARVRGSAALRHGGPGRGRKRGCAARGGAQAALSRAGRAEGAGGRLRRRAARLEGLAPGRGGGALRHRRAAVRIVVAVAHR